MEIAGELSIAPHPTLSLLFFLCQLQPLDEAVLQQKPSVNAVATLEKVIEIQSAWGQAKGLISQPAQGAGRAYGSGFHLDQAALPEPVGLFNVGKHWSCVQRFAAGLGCSLREAQTGEKEEAETVSAMALLSVGAEQAQAAATQEHSPR